MDDERILGITKMKLQAFSLPALEMILGDKQNMQNAKKDFLNFFSGVGGGLEYLAQRFKWPFDKNFVDPFFDLLGTFLAKKWGYRGS